MTLKSCGFKASLRQASEAAAIFAALKAVRQTLTMWVYYIELAAHSLGQIFLWVSDCNTTGPQT
jgi:ribosomal protein S11